MPLCAVERKRSEVNEILYKSNWLLEQIILASHTGEGKALIWDTVHLSSPLLIMKMLTE